MIEKVAGDEEEVDVPVEQVVVGVGVVGIITIFVASMRATVDEGIDRAFTSDLVVDAGASVNGGVTFVNEFSATRTPLRSQIKP